MERALELARRGLFTTGENPRVGCVIVQQGEIVGEGWHRYAGGPHAEVVALSAAGEKSRGATAYVTLEPCCHRGRTGPCTTALIEAGIRRVVCAMPDPNPRVSGRGGKILEAAGITYESGLMRDVAAALNSGFIRRMRHGRPFVRLKLAASVDGRTGLANGESRWITGPEARADVQYWRARSDALATGSGTVRMDDPKLNARLDAELVQPLRVVLDPDLDTSPDARIYGGDRQAVVVCGPGVDPARRQGFLGRGVDVVVAEEGASGIALGAFLDWLGERGINELWVECGATLAGRFLEDGLVDELVLYLAPKVLGSRERPMFDLPPLSSLKEGIGLEFRETRVFGKDIRIIAEVTN